MRPAIRWIVAALALLLAGILVDTARAAPREGLRRALAPYLPQERLNAPVQSAVLLQRSDCRGNLRMLDLLHRASVRESLQLAVLWYVGSSADTAVIRAALPEWSAHVPLRPAPAAALAELDLLGHRSTPIVVVMDQAGRIRLTSQSPRSVREFAGLQRVIEGLTWIDEL